METIDYKKELNRIFAEYATFFDLPVKTTEEKGDVYTLLPRSLFANLMLKEAFLLEHLAKGHFSLKELGEDCAALYGIAEGNFNGINKPDVCLDVAKIPKTRWYLYLEGKNRIIEDIPARAYGLEFEPEPAHMESRRIKPIVLWLAGITIAFFAGYAINRVPNAVSIPPPTPVPVVADSMTATQSATPSPTRSSTPSFTAGPPKSAPPTASPTVTATASSTPRPKPKPKPKPKVVQPKPTLTPTRIPIPTLTEHDDSIYTED